MNNSYPPFIKKALLEDVNWIIDLAYKQMNNYLEYAYTGPFDWETWENEMRGIIFTNKVEDGIVQVFYSEDILDNVGFWWITPYSDHLWIDAFVIKPQYQIRGIGSSLIGNLKEILKIYYPLNHLIELGVQKNNEIAINFYQKRGFKIKDDTYLEMFNTIRMVKKM
ncbi:MAG: GNAT family N-acetyltransferase [Candidatus Hodarchaeales archaeon]|jgi:ribosomal protein S18 acetylase RimI-like enzyme